MLAIFGEFGVYQMIQSPDFYETTCNFQNSIAKHLIMTHYDYHQWSILTWRFFPREPEIFKLE
jgi:hypothetical protein